MKIRNSNELVFLPLGGAGEIGMNLNLYGCRDKWIIVDLGVSFGDDSMHGVEIFMPDPSFITDRSSDLLGIILTHAHEDHLGAVVYLWSRLKCPVYASPFATSLLRMKLTEAGLENEVVIHTVSLGERVQLGSFIIEFIAQTHSIPESSSLLIDTPFGRILHTGDWKFDPKPIISSPADIERLQFLGDSGILAVVGDSTNVFKQKTSGSEYDVRESLIELFSHFRSRIAVTCFASNVARVESIAIAAQVNDRHVALVGRSLWRINKIARENGYLSKVPLFLTENDAVDLPVDKISYICTGSQGEPRTALMRIANNINRNISLTDGDVVIFSSRIIPGNELSIFKLQNKLISNGVRVITENDHLVHVSGHPGRDEVIHLYNLIRPLISVPVHGEVRHLKEHANLAKNCGVPKTVILQNGEILKLAPGDVKIVNTVSTGRLIVDGTRLINIDSVIMHDRHEMMQNGNVVATIVLNKFGKLLKDPQISNHGLFDDKCEIEAYESIVSVIHKVIDEMLNLEWSDDNLIQEAILIALRRHLKKNYHKKPLIDLHLVRI
ncbi:MAG: ribonuclease J [Rhodospirillaceae bacterium]|jgi:ribonuclease J|nr:ribonuclease J [Rhodospirillaceae bacterium]